MAAATVLLSVVDRVATCDSGTWLSIWLSSARTCPVSDAGGTSDRTTIHIVWYDGCCVCGV